MRSVYQCRHGGSLVHIFGGLGQEPQPRTLAGASGHIDSQWDAVYVLHCFLKKTQKTSKADLDVAKNRYRNLMKELGQ